MSAPSENFHEGASAAPAALAPTRPIYWSVRRELWENRSLYVAPLVVAGVALVGFALSTIGMPQRRLATLQLPRAEQIAVIGEPYDSAAMAIIVTTFIVGVVYCLGALHGERRDRSILFWKSLPVSDLQTVIAKVLIPLAVLPAIAAGVILATQLAMLIWSTVILMMSGVSPAIPLSATEQVVVLLYGLVAMTLWYAPIYGWLMLVSGWARRVTFLWAVLPPVALCLLEYLSFRTTHLAALFGDRISGGYQHAFAAQPHGHSMVPAVGLAQLDPAGFLTTPGLWIGLAFAAAFLAAAVWQRRRREPI
jgi:ABC-2 type transport system permease protein